MRNLRQNLALQCVEVNHKLKVGLRQAIWDFADATTSRGKRQSYFRRLQLLALGSPRAMNFLDHWLVAIWKRSLPRNAREAEKAWDSLVHAAKAVVVEIREKIEASHES